MKCCLCGAEINPTYSNNPFPLVAKEDYDSRCCNDCDQMYVIKARLFALHGVVREPKIGEKVLIFYSSNSDFPVKTICGEESKTVCGGEVTGKGEKENTFVGTWGNFPLDIKEDNYIIAPL